jgi:flagellar hook-associated protein 1 FlgK
MADMLNIASVSANAFKRALEVTSHNVANVATDGYSRQRVELASNAPQLSGLGGGTNVSSVERVYSQYLQEQLYSSGSQLNRYESQLTMSKQVEGVVASNDDGVQQFMQRFFDSLQALSDNPTSSTSRQLVLEEARNLESHIGNLTSVLDDIQYQTNGQIRDITSEVNNRLETIQELNDRVEYAQNYSSQPPNDLLDRRDQAILEISEYIDVKAYYHENGSVDLYTGGGRLPLVSGNTLTRIESDISEYPDENRTELFMTIGGVRTQISDYIVGGQLGGVLDFRDKMLDQSQKDLGLTINGMVASINWQHFQGYDMGGDAGEEFFAALSSTGYAHQDNDGSSDNISVSFNPAQPASGFNGEPPYTAPTQPATYGDKQEYLENAYTAIGQMEPREYEVKYNGTSAEFEVYERGQRTLLGSFTAATPAIIDGLEFMADGTNYSDGDSFVVKPHRDILDDFQSAITDTDKIATRGQSPLDSDSDGSLDDEVPAAAAIGDNVNIANMAGLMNKKVLLADSSGLASESILGGYSKMSSNVGAYVRGTDILLEAQTNVQQQIIDQRESYSGVSLDEEAANLIRFQQAYEASAQIMSTSQQIFQTLIGIARG